MALDPKFIGREYGPFRYEVGEEKVREFAYAVGGTIPSTGFLSNGAPEGMNPVMYDHKAGKASSYGSMVALPSFAVVFAIAPFGLACVDHDLKINLLMLVHGEQDFEFFDVIRPGDTMTTTGRITDIYSKAGKDFLVVTTESKNQHGTLVVKGIWNAVIRS